MRHSALTAVTALALFCACGKRQAAPEPERRPVSESEAIEESPFRYRAPAPVRQNPDTLLTSGKLPLAHLLETGGAIRVVNATANQILLTQTVPPRTLIGVSASGVLVGGKKVLAGPLAAEQEYQIWLDARR